MAQAVEELGEVQVEVAEESVGGDAVGQRDAQQAPVFADPAVERGDLAVDQARAELLVGFGLTLVKLAFKASRLKVSLIDLPQDGEMEQI